MIETPPRRSFEAKVEDDEDDFDTPPGSPEPKKGWLGNITGLFSGPSSSGRSPLGREPVTEEKPGERAATEKSETPPVSQAKPFVPDVDLEERKPW